MRNISFIRVDFVVRCDSIKMAQLRNVDKNMTINGYVCFGVSLPWNVLEEIDSVRGDVPRSRWLRQVGMEALQRQRKNLAKTEKKGDLKSKNE